MCAHNYIIYLTLPSYWGRNRSYHIFLKLDVHNREFQAVPHILLPLLSLPLAYLLAPRLELLSTLFTRLFLNLIIFCLKNLRVRKI